MKIFKKNINLEELFTSLFVSFAYNVGRALTLSCIIVIAAWIAEKELEFSVWQIWGLTTLGFIGLSFIASVLKRKI